MATARGEAVPGGGGAAAACRPAWGRRGGGLWRVPTWFLACLYRVCFKVSESKVELSTSLTSSASSAALRRSSPFPKVGIGSKANRPPGRSSTHLHQRPERGLPLAGLASRHLSDAPQLAPCLHARHGISTGHVHEETDTRTHGHLDGSHTDAGERQREMSTCTHCKQQAGRWASGMGGSRGHLGSRESGWLWSGPGLLPPALRGGRKRAVSERPPASTGLPQEDHGALTASPVLKAGGERLGPGGRGCGSPASRTVGARPPPLTACWRPDVTALGSSAGPGPAPSQPSPPPLCFRAWGSVCLRARASVGGWSPDPLSGGPASPPPAHRSPCSRNACWEGG